jgi:hypothetical protein
MNNRISKYMADLHPLDQPEMMDRLRLLRALATVAILVNIMITFLVIAVVYFALGGRPLSGNAGKVMGLPIVTIIAAVLMVLAILISLVQVPRIWAKGIQRVKTTLPDPPEPGASIDTDGERMWQVYAAGRFCEIALTMTAIILTAIMFHLTADWTMIGFIAVLIAFLSARFPTEARAREWFERV